jgi:sRNA-binding regulator protein Hfq
VSESHASIPAEDTLPASQRKLVRPVLPDQLQRLQRREPSPLLAHREGSATPLRSSHAEVFYFQKQMQAQTPMVFVLDDGERIEGIIEWYDAHSIKVRHATRTLIYKAAIKYLYKAGEAHP